MTRTLVVVGGGIAGLTTAFELMERTRGRADAPQVLCLEAAPQAGGKVRSDHVSGFTCEWGPNGFLDNAPATRDLIRRLGIEDRVQPSRSAAARQRSNPAWRAGPPPSRASMRRPASQTTASRSHSFLSLMPFPPQNRARPRAGRPGPVRAWPVRER